MVTATRTTSDAAALAHLLETVLAPSATSSIRLSLQLNGYDDLQSVDGIFESELESLEITVYSLRQSSTPMAIPGNHSCSAVADFKQGVKRDKTHYAVLKDDRYWDNFYRTFVVTAVLHNVDNVLDPAYSPTDPDEISLFKEQKKFVYSALEHSAKISSGTTLSYLTSAKYGSSWTGTAEGLSCIGKPSTHLQQYRANYGTFATATLPQFAQVLSTLYDKGNNLSNSRSPKTKRSAFVAETIFPDNNYGVDYDIDLSPSILYEANAHNRRAGDQNRDRQGNVNREQPYIPRETWDKLSDDAKAILRGMSSPAEGQASPNSKSRPAFHANSHSLADMGHPSPTNNSLNESDNEKFNDCGNDSELLVHLTDCSSPMANGDIRKVLASASSHKKNANNSLQSNMLEYTISRHSIVGTTSSLIDRGANGGLAGSNVKVINKTGRSASITGINDHTLPDLDIVTAAGLVESQNGPIIVVLHQYAHHGKGKLSILAHN